ncbi:hypothetical protein O0235_13765 [Tepidiforma flava]|uniref:Uncharacterized protein n=1 Tax=Tepidiforma flava TaxID=3004094 RepID=A0ABY7M6Q1_9CHLR|nr:hypothetical protein [Tepidiforma flava]WBL35817.1 hypothetical protein O0235_13765 [Tepidiforma flava]
MRSGKWKTIEGSRGVLSTSSAEDVEDLSKDAAGFEAGHDGRAGGEPEAFEREVAGAAAGTGVSLEQGRPCTGLRRKRSGDEAAEAAADDGDVEVGPFSHTTIVWTST